MVPGEIDEGKGRAPNRATLFFGGYNGFTTRRRAGIHEVYKQEINGINRLTARR